MVQDADEGDAMTPEQAAKVAALAARCDALSDEAHALLAEVGACAGGDASACAWCVLVDAEEALDVAASKLQGLAQ